MIAPDLAGKLLDDAIYQRVLDCIDLEALSAMATIGRMPGLEPSLFGLVLVVVILFEPGGIYGRWLKIKRWFQAYPLKRRTGFRRQKTYARSERLR